jgi:hypothetical protein
MGGNISQYDQEPARPAGRARAQNRLSEGSATLSGTVDTKKDSGGCVVYGYNHNNKVELDVRPEGQLPQLEELSFPLFLMEDMIKWGNKGGWTILQSLKIDNTSIIPAFADRVPALRSLQANVPWTDMQLYKPHFCRLGSLEELTLNGKDMRFPRDILEVYGPTLTSLTVHVPKPYVPERRPDIPLAELQWLKKTCPKLKALGMDMKRNGQWVGLLSIPNSCSLSPCTANAIVSQLTTNPALHLPARARHIPQPNRPHARTRR